MYKRNIGRIHPEFFNKSSLFRKFGVFIKDEGEVELRSPFFVLKYSLKDGVLECEDEEVLLDFVDLIEEKYSINITRDEFKKTIDFNSINTDYLIINVGTCYFKDSYAGYDGSINAIWYDNKPPAEVLSIHFQYWSNKMLTDAWSLKKETIGKFGKVSLVIPNLLDSLSMVKTKEKKKKVSELLYNLM